MLVSCSRCGAPLDVQAGRRLLTCRYCGAKSLLSGLTTLAPETPPGWKPPPVWTPPPGMAAPGHALPYRRDDSMLIAAGCSAGVLMFLALSIGFALLDSRDRASPETTAPRDVTPAVVTHVTAEPIPAARPAAPGAKRLEGGAWDGRTPILCAGDDVVTLTGRVARVTASPLVRASGRCQVRLTDCDLTAPTVLDLSDDARATVERGRLASTSAGNKVLVAAGRSRVVLRRTRVEASDPSALAVRALDFAHVELVDASVSGATHEEGAARVVRAVSRPTQTAGAKSPAAQPVQAPPPAAPASKPPKPLNPCGCAPGDLGCSMACRR